MKHHCSRAAAALCIAGLALAFPAAAQQQAQPEGEAPQAEQGQTPEAQQGRAPQAEQGQAPKPEGEAPQAEQGQAPKPEGEAPQPQGQAAQPKEVVKATYGAWEIHCLEGTDKCAMQQIGKTAEGKTALQVSVERLAGVTADGKPVPAAMTVRTPLGVLIPYMVRVRVDDGDVQSMPLMRCVPESCLARAPMSEQAVNVLKQGAKATFGIFLNNEILVEISLDGFTKAYSELKPIEAQAQN